MRMPAEMRMREFGGMMMGRQNFGAMVTGDSGCVCVTWLRARLHPPAFES